MPDEQETYYVCVGICQADPDSGYCLGCGRPPLESPGIVAEAAVMVIPVQAAGNDPDTPT